MDGGKAIQIVILDSSGMVVNSGPLSSLKVEILILRGEFASDDQEDWTEEDFITSVVREREGKRPLLIGDTIISLRNGVGSVADLNITDNSCWMPSRKFRLGARVLHDSRTVERIREAKTEAFPVKDHRGESYRKHYPPILKDEVWRLENIMKGGIFHQRLADKGINTVEEFLRHLVVYPEGLRNVLLMSNKQWDSTAAHARTCNVNNDIFLSIAVGTDQQVVLLFNSIYEVMGILSDGQLQSIHDLDIGQQEIVDNIKKEVYRNWRSITEPQKRGMLDAAPRAEEANHSFQNQSFQTTTVGPYQDQLDEKASVSSTSSSVDMEILATRPVYDPLQQCNFMYERGSNEESVEHEDNLDGPQCSPFSASQPCHNLVPEGLLIPSHDRPLISDWGQENWHFHGRHVDSWRHLSTDFAPCMSKSYKAALGWLKLRAVLIWVVIVKRDAAVKRRVAAKKWERVFKFLQC
ncbi:calmodulin-binding protein 60 E-like [Nymphaea colorata]|nr:calmodulin-binding protein 60 E-like [Nymphaea colorata]